jgi:hypothetical protein
VKTHVLLLPQHTANLEVFIFPQSSQEGEGPTIVRAVGFNIIHQQPKGFVYTKALIRRAWSIVAAFCVPPVREKKGPEMEGKRSTLGLEFEIQECLRTTLKVCPSLRLLLRQ